MISNRISDRSVIGFLLVGLGVMFLLDTTNALGPGTDIVGTYWPALLIAWALWGIISSGFALRLWSVLLLVVGVVFLLSNLNIWDWGLAQLWPILLVLVGLALLFGHRLHRRRRRRSWVRFPGFVYSGREGPQHGVRESAPAGRRTHDFTASHIFGAGKEQVTDQDFQGGEVSAIFGGMELDLRDARLAEAGAVLEATVVCGGIEVRVPRDWRVHFETTTLFGGVEDKRPRPGTGDARGELIITGAVVCGGIEVKD